MYVRKHTRSTTNVANDRRRGVCIRNGLVGKGMGSLYAAT